MGIPRFFRWVSERYPQINQRISDVSLLPEFDNLYLDLNGIIHQCTHPNDQEVCEELGDPQQIPAIFAYIDRIVTHIVKPKQLLFLAVDGVAPRAKLNQQRSRRFRAGMELHEKNLALQRDRADDDEEGPRGALFDSNCITPGTEFMYRLSQHLQYFIRKKLKEDPAWRNLTVIFSGQEVPGEGEHKIVEYIRRTKMQPGYPPNVRHCMYGSDADLMLLGIMTHEPHFTLLREVVDFTGGRRSARDENTKKIVARQTKEQEWQLVHLSVFREYLDMELRADVPWYDTERALDDFIFLTFLLGNDFIPHSPTLDISENAIALLLDIYRSKLPEWGDYITRGGVLAHPCHLEDLCRTIGALEEGILVTRADEERRFQQRKRFGRAPVEKPVAVAAADDDLDEEEAFTAELLAALETPTNGVADEMAVLSGSVDFQATKWAYYKKKFGVTDTRPELLHAVKVAYVEALVWCLGYYFQGVPSWSWFYPFHYSPMLSDLTDIGAIVAELRLEPGAPFLPFQQLLSTLPPTSANLVPGPYQQLMTDPASPIASFYPMKFEIDMEGKRNPWEGVNLLPFIDATALIAAIDEYCPDSRLSDADRARNRAGVAYRFTFDAGNMETLPSTLPSVFADVPLCHSKREVYKLPPLTDFDAALVDGVTLPIAGFPSLHALPVEATYLAAIGVNCFGMSSKKQTMVVKVAGRPAPSLDEARALLGTTVHVNYPNMHEALVCGVSSAVGACRIGDDGAVVVLAHDDAAARTWTKTANIERQRYLGGRAIPGTGGVQLGEISAFLHVQPLQGMVTDAATGATTKLFGSDEVAVPFQLAATALATVDERFVEKPPLTPTERFPVGAAVLVVAEGAAKGACGVVVGHSAGDAVQVEVVAATPEPPFGYAVADSIGDKFFPSHVVSQRLGISPGTLGRLTGSLLVNPGRYDIGLNIKFKKELALAGYCRYEPKARDDRPVWGTGDSVAIVGSDAVSSAATVEGAWEYSEKAFHLLLAYQRKFPRVFAAVETLPYSAVYDGTAFLEVQPALVKVQLEAIQTYLAQLDIAAVPLVPVTSTTMSAAAVTAVQKAGEIRAAQNLAAAKTTLTVAPAQLFRAVASNYDLSASQVGSGPPVLGDRVVNLAARSVPFGLRGTVVATHAVSGCVEVVFDVAFGGGSTLHGLCAPNRGKLVPWSALLRVSTRPGTKPAALPGAAPKTKAKSKPSPTEKLKAETKLSPQPKAKAKAQKTPKAQEKGVPQLAKQPPAPPSLDKMSHLIHKWAAEEERKQSTITRDLAAPPASSMAHYFQQLQQAPPKKLLQPTAAAYQPPLPPPPTAYAPPPMAYAPPPTVYTQPPLPRGPPPVSTSSSSGLLLPAQVLRSKYNAKE
ncbi:5'-3' exoribonuclease 1 (ISS) [Achlya hypogyna]|uniref:5'-3' exoribonuclease 1 n=1 Tax=Achlya hypogyna TaxID=1202772 RepID=A0A1V9Y4Z8_ACHHY|nr:5'-3' exoribonuclease 1 (ISS) [Achlya hypogyna]